MARDMKETGKEWIGQIPSHWKLKRIKNIIAQTTDGIKIGPFGSALTNKTKDKGEYNVYSQANLIAADFSSTKNTIDEETFDNLQAYEVYPDDICLSMMGTIGKCKKVPTGIKRGIMDSHLIKIRLSEDIDSRFFEYVYDKDLGGVCFQQMQFDKKGFIMDGLNTSIVKNLYFPMPPLEEQASISDYLDSECSRIDSVIEQTRASIEEYKKLKQAVITQAVTKGIRPGRVMKDSGIEWIGEIPEQWTVCKQKHVIQLINGRAYSDDEFEEDGKYKILRVGNLFSNPKWYTSSLELDSNKYCDNGDLLYAWSMTYAPVIWRGEKVIYHYHIWKTVLSPQIEKEFAYYYFIVLTEAVRAEKHETTMGFITMGVMNNSYIAFPQVDEQREIVKYLNGKCSSIDHLIEKKTQLLSGLESYKKSLIYEYVTGKKEVPVCQ